MMRNETEQLFDRLKAEADEKREERYIEEMQICTGHAPTQEELEDLFRPESGEERTR